jgi:serine protease Do
MKTKTEIISNRYKTAMCRNSLAFCNSVRLAGRPLQHFALVAIFLAAAASLPAQTKAPLQPTPQQTDRKILLQQFSDSLDELAARVSPAIVQIRVTGYRAIKDEDSDDDSAAPIGKQRSLGSGVIVDPDGYIITNAHVVKGAQRIRVLLTPASAGDSQVRSSLGVGEHIPPKDAKIIGIAPAMDLALLKIDGKDLPTLPFADYTQVKKGQLVLAFGNPEGLENSVTMGIVSSVARQADPNVPSVYIQTDAPINPGNSGGPLVDTEGRLVGINTFILSETGGSQGLGFAIPSSIVQFVYLELRKFGRVHRGVIGVVLQEITPDLAAGLHLPIQEGVIISDVVPGGPAERAGLKIQDILLSLEGREIGSVPIAQMIVSTRASGSTLHAVILRNGEKIPLEIRVSEAKNEVDQLADIVDPNKSLVPKLGIFGVEINDQLGADLSDLRIESGVAIAALSADSARVDADFKAGDIIHAVNGKNITTLDGLRAALDAIAPGASCVLQIERDGKLSYLAFEMD